MTAEIFEIIMVVLFGASWPINIVRSARAKTAKGKSLLFLIIILIGYFAGIAAKLLNAAYLAEINKKWYVLFFYILNAVMVAVDICLYVRNHRLDVLRDKEKDGQQTAPTEPTEPSTQNNSTEKGEQI